MSDANVDPDFYFTVKDFRSCTGRKKDAQHLYSRFKELITAIKNTQMFNQEFADFKGYVARPFNQGSKEFKNHMWLGFAYQQYERPQDEVQLQAGTSKDEPLTIELFIDQAARRARQEAKLKIEKNRTMFLNLCRELSDCSVGYVDYWGTDMFQAECRSVNEADLTRILQKMGERRIHFFIERDMSKSQIDKVKRQIVLEIVHTWVELRPIYDFLAPSKVTSDKSEMPAMRIVNDKGIIRNIERHFSSKEIDLDETEAKAAERESKQIIYEMNWLAQEKASSSHRKTVMLLANYLKAHGVKPLQSVIDTLAQKNDSVFIFEVKSVHTRNFVHQTRTAIGQLLDYEYFQIRSKPENKGKDIIRAIVYSKKPTQQIIDFLRTYQFSVFWTEAGNLSGNAKSKQVLAKFLSAG